jgi:uracil-DNA glycosylase
MIAFDIPDSFEDWRDQAKALLQARVPPAQVHWGAATLFGSELPVAQDGAAAEVSVPAAFVKLAQTVFMHSDPSRLDLLYRLLWRVQASRFVLQDATNRDVVKAELLVKGIRRDIHKMRAFVRFREVETEGSENQYVAWFEPDHDIVRTNARFFANRFTTMHWSILTPSLCIHWDTQTLRESPGIAKPDDLTDDPAEDLWRSYYASIFNPARLKTKAMLKEMPRRYWKNMPEADLIPSMIAGAQAREAAMIAIGSAPAEPAPQNWDQLHDSINRCTRCPLHCDATQAVHGAGPTNAPLMIVGEQPGDQEDLAGTPFIGPAGQVLNEALRRVGINREAAYLTNAVKHFKHEHRGKLRLHQTPNASEIDHCRWWLDAERELLQPQLILALGASAVRGLTGKTDSITKLRGRPIPLPDGSIMIVTTHPSYVLRIGEAQREAAMATLVDDLRVVTAMLADTTNPLALPAIPA